MGLSDGKLKQELTALVNTDLWIVALQEIRLGAKKENDKMNNCITHATLRAEDIKVVQSQLEKLEFQHTEAKKELQHIIILTDWSRRLY